MIFVLASTAFSLNKMTASYDVANLLLWFGILLTLGAVIWVGIQNGPLRKRSKTRRETADADNGRLAEDNQVLRRVLVDLVRATSQAEQECNLSAPTLSTLRAASHAAESVLIYH